MFRHRHSILRESSRKRTTVRRAIQSIGSPLLELYINHSSKDDAVPRLGFFLYFADRASQYIYLNINQLDALHFFCNEFMSCLYMF